jgi:glycosyltransferase involved in cell wall biosynthesis
MIKKIIDKFKNRFPPDKNWKFQPQTEPPTFGYAKFITEKELNKEVLQRKKKCQEIIANTYTYCKIKKEKVAIVVLTYKRWNTLNRLIKSMQPFFDKIETYRNIEKIIVDNGSGEDYIQKIHKTGFFDTIVKNKTNIGMVGALKSIFKEVDSEYIMFIEDDFILDYNEPFVDKLIKVFDQYPEIGLIRLKNQNNWWKPHRIISPLRITNNNTKFWTWIPTKDLKLNGWCAGSVIFRKVSYISTGELPDVNSNVSRTNKKVHQGYIYECEYGSKYNESWLTAKVVNCYPFLQPNDNEESPGWNENE